MFDLGRNAVARILYGATAKNNLSRGDELIWQYNPNGQPPTAPATGLGVVLENINGSTPTAPATGLTAVLENLG